MTGVIKNIYSEFDKKCIVVDMRIPYTCSFTQFHPFSAELYFFSSFKDFRTSSRA